jgi:hypothetical protein
MRYQTTTALTPHQALEQAITDFGPGGVGPAEHVPGQSRPSLPGWWRAHGRARTAWHSDDVSIGDA